MRISVCAAQAQIGLSDGPEQPLFSWPGDGVFAGISTLFTVYTQNSSKINMFWLREHRERANVTLAAVDFVN